MADNQPRVATQRGRKQPNIAPIGKISHKEGIHMNQKKTEKGGSPRRCKNSPQRTEPASMMAPPRKAVVGRAATGESSGPAAQVFSVGVTGGDTMEVGQERMQLQVAAGFYDTMVASYIEASPLMKSKVASCS